MFNSSLQCTAHAQGGQTRYEQEKLFLTFSNSCILDFPILIYSHGKLSFCTHASTYEKKIEPILAHKSKLPSKPNKIMIKIALFAWPPTPLLVGRYILKQQAREGGTRPIC